MESHTHTVSTPKILISRLSAHGDVIQTLPLLAAIKQADPKAFVGWVIEESAAPLLEGHPWIDRLHISKRKAWMTGLQDPRQWLRVFKELGGFIQELRQERYTVGLDVQGLLKSALLIFLAAIPRRIGYADTRENASLFYTETLPFHNLRDPHIPTVLKFMEFAQRLGYPPLSLETDPKARTFFPLPPVSVAATQKMQAALAGLNPSQTLIAIAPATIWPSKHWKEEAWEALVDYILKKGHALVVLGAPKDADLGRRIVRDHAASPALVNLVGQTQWPDLYALFSRVDVLIAVDSAPLHVAQAVGHPRIIGLFGPTAPQRTGPLGQQHKSLATSLACQPCFERICPLKTHACMEELTVSRVIEALEALPQSSKSCIDPVAR